MTLKSRLFVLLGVMLFTLTAGLFTLKLVHRAEERSALRSLQDDREALLERVLPMLDYPLRQFTRDYSLWDDMLTFVDHPDPEWGRVNLEASLASFDLARTWVLDAEGRQKYSAKRSEQSVVPALPLGTRELLPFFQKKPFGLWYLRSGDDVFAMQVAPIQPSDDVTRASTPRGWLIAARHLDAKYLKTVSDLTGSKIELAGPSTPPPDIKPTHASVSRELRNLFGQTTAVLQLDYEPWVLTQSYNLEEALIMGGNTLLLILITIVCLHRWVLQPFKIIDESLVTSNPDTLKPLLNTSTEVGHIARLIRIHFAHQKALRQTMEERDQLARDLHDGVIQSIYAAGMGVSAAQSLLKTDPTAAGAQLEQIRIALNQTIAEARGFISGLEKSSEADVSFSRAVETLTDSMKWIHDSRIVCEIDETAAQELPPIAKAQALQIIREAVSNSLRHGEAKNVKVALRRDTGGIVLAIDDDGRGFDDTSRRRGGRGLANLIERTQSLGARASVHSAVGRGTRISVVFPPNQFHP